jgi:hypothetical protein
MQHVRFYTSTRLCRLSRLRGASGQSTLAHAPCLRLAQSSPLVLSSSRFVVVLVLWLYNSTAITVETGLSSRRRLPTAKQASWGSALAWGRG